MTRNDFIRTLEKALSVDEGTFADGAALSSIPEWDSLGIVEFQAYADEEFGLELAPEKINACETVDDLVGLVAAKLEG